MRGLWVEVGLGVEGLWEVSRSRVGYWRITNLTITGGQGSYFGGLSIGGVVG